MNIHPRYAIGGLFGGMGGSSSRYVNGQHHSYSVGAAFGLVQGKYKAIIQPTYVLDIDAGIGVVSGGATNVIDDEAGTIEHNSRRKHFQLAGLLGVTGRYRVTPLMHVDLGVGYFYAPLRDVERSGQTYDDLDLDLSGPYLKFGFGGNF